MVPQFVARTAQAAAPGKDNILVVLEMTGGNDGLNTVIPYADDLYHKARPTLRQTKDVVIRLDDHVGLNSAMQGFRPMWEKGQLAVVQGVGYPNPERSHFEAMDIWQSADPEAGRHDRLAGAGGSRDEELRRAACRSCRSARSGLPLALTGAPGGGAVTVNDQNSFRLELGGGKADAAEGAAPAAGGAGDARPGAGDDDLASFIQRRQVQTLTAVETLRELLEGPKALARGRARACRRSSSSIAGLIARGFGTRIFYVSLDGFDTHAGQATAHANLLADLANSINGFFETLKKTGNDSRVRLMTFSEFGRRVQENGSRGTDHGAGSCLFLAGPSVKGGRGRQAPEPGRPRRRRPEVPHRLPPRLRHPARRLAGLRQQGRALGQVGACQGARGEGVTRHRASGCF